MISRNKMNYEICEPPDGSLYFSFIRYIFDYIFFKIILEKDF